MDSRPPKCLDKNTNSLRDCGADIRSEPIHFPVFFHECLAILVVRTLGGWGTFSQRWWVQYPVSLAK